MAYTTPPTWVNGSTNALNATNLNILSQDLIDHESRIGSGGDSVAVYRVDPSGSASTDQSNIAAAIASANAEANGAKVYISEGDYNDIDGGFTPGAKVQIQGAGRGLTRIFHSSAANGGADWMFRWTAASSDTRHGISDLLIWGPGTSLADARGVVQENSYGFYMKGVEVSNYRGSGNSAGLEIHNSTTYSEGILLFDCRFTKNIKQVYAHKSGTGTDSLSDFDIFHTIMMNNESQIGIHLDGVTPYASSWQFKGMNEMAVDGTQKATALYFTNTAGFRGFWNITWEGTNSTVGNSGWLIRTDGTHQIVADGKFINYDSTAQPATHSITSGSGFIRIDNTIGGRVSVGDANRTLDVNVDPNLISFGTNLTANRSCSVFHNLRGLPRRFRVVRDEPVPSSFLVTVNMDTATPFIFPSYSKGWVDLQLSTSGWSIAGSYLDPVGSNLALATPAEVDDFTTGGAASGQIGKWGWIKSAAGNVARIAGTGNHPGIISVDTSGTISTRAYIVAASPANTGFTADGLFDISFVAKLATTDTDAQFRIGLTSDETTQTPADGVYFEKLYADTTWFPVTRASSLQTRGTAMLATDTSWHSFRLRRLTSTAVAFSMDGGTEQQLTTNLPTGGVSPFVAAVNQAAASKSIQVDLARMVVAGLSRTV